MTVCVQKPDMIYMGWMKELGWEEYNIPGPNNQSLKYRNESKKRAELVRRDLE